MPKQLLKKRKDGRYVKTKVVDGKRMYFYGDTPAEAITNASLNKKEEKPVKETRSFLDVAEDWKYMQLAKSPNAMRCYGAPYGRIVEYFGSCPLSDITKEDVEEFIKRIISKGYSYKTVKTHRQIINNICGIYVDLPKGLPKGKRELPTDDQIQLIKDNVNDPFGLFPYFILYTGCRRGEALAVKHEDIKDGMLNINKSVMYVTNQPTIKKPKTEAGNRQIPVPDVLLKKIPNGKGFLFGNELPLSEQMFRRKWEGYCKRTGCSITPHQIRHAYCTILYDNGIDLKSAQALMGHADIKVTLDIYTHLSATRNKTVNDKLKNLM